jgi:hypothetical protein
VFQYSLVLTSQHDAVPDDGGFPLPPDKNAIQGTREQQCLPPQLIPGFKSIPFSSVEQSGVF